MAVKNTGKSFEQIVQEIYQAFLDFDTQEKAFRRIDVEHNVVVHGKSGTTHQVDVYWKFALCGQIYETIVEVKDWKTPVKQEQLHSFKAVLDDIPGFPSGIFVSRSGFQEGAMKYASAHGIKLIQIIEDCEAPSLRIHISDTTTHYEGLHFLSDDERLENNLLLQAIINNSFNSKKDYDDALVINPKGDKVLLADLLHIDAIPYYYAPAGEVHYIEQHLQGEWFWVCNLPQIPMIKIFGYSFECYNTIENSIYELRHAQLPYYHIKDLSEKVEHGYNSLTKEFLKCV